jgi:triosephosphate isomerase
LAEKVNTALANGVSPIFCCGESFDQRQNEDYIGFVKNQITESLFHLTEEQLKSVVIAYEPIWAIGTGLTASAEQAQDMHAALRAHIASKYGADAADEISILYGGSVTAASAPELFAAPDIDGGLVGGASSEIERIYQHHQGEIIFVCLSVVEGVVHMPSTTLRRTKKLLGLCDYEFDAAVFSVFFC